MKVLLLNGPPGCGKDTAGRLIAAARPVDTCFTDKFSRVVKERTHAAYDLISSYGEPLPHDYFELRKDIPLAEFRGVTPRAAYIQFSEGFMKPLHGPAVFGQILLEDWRRIEPGCLLVITDSGFRDEAIPFVEHFGPENLIVVRIHRRGHTFAGDSRSYLDLADLHVAGSDVVNPGTEDGLLAVLARALPQLEIA